MSSLSLLDRWDDKAMRAFNDLCMQYYFRGTISIGFFFFLLLTYDSTTDLID